jgi:integrase
MTGAFEMPRRLPPHCIEDLDRHGNPRIYLRIRKKLYRKIRLRGLPWTPEFMAQYQAALEGVCVPDKRNPLSTRGAVGTWRWLTQQYFASPDYLHLSIEFQTVRRRILEATFDEPTKPGSSYKFGDCMIADMSKKAIRILRDRKMDVPEGANNRLKAIRRVFTYGLEAHEEYVKSNPARDVAYFKTGSEGYYTWTVEDVMAYAKRHHPGTMARRALCVLLYTGVRRSDAVLLGRQMVQNGILTFTVQKKRKTDKPKMLHIPVLPELHAELARGPQNNLTWLTTKYNKPFTANGFGNWFKDRCREAGLEQCSAHGLRKAGATMAAESGASDAQLMAIFGWETVKMASEYRRKADRRLLAENAMKFIQAEGLDLSAGSSK